MKKLALLLILTSSFASCMQHSHQTCAINKFSFDENIGESEILTSLEKKMIKSELRTKGHNVDTDGDLVIKGISIDFKPQYIGDAGRNQRYRLKCNITVTGVDMITARDFRFRGTSNEVKIVASGITEDDRTKYCSVSGKAFKSFFKNVPSCVKIQ